METIRTTRGDYDISKGFPVPYDRLLTTEDGLKILMRHYEYEVLKGFDWQRLPDGKIGRYEGGEAVYLKNELFPILPNPLNTSHMMGLGISMEVD